MAKTTSFQKKTYKGKSGSKYSGKSTKEIVYVNVNKSPLESKEINTAVSGSVSVGGYQVNLNSIASGSDTGQRIGRAIKGARLHYNCLILGPTSSGLIDYLRVMLIYDAASNVANPFSTEFLESGAGGNIVNMIKNSKSYPKRFTFLMDKIIPVQNQSSGGSCNGDKDSQAFQGSIDLSRYPVTRFSSTAATVPANGNIFLYVVSYQNTGVVTTSAGLYANFKYTYYDD